MSSHAPEESDAHRLQEQWQRHPVLYFEDGTVVLLANTTVFRVYFGLLSMHSEVLRGMAALTPHQPEDGESYDGCPVIRLTDDARDVEYFLGAMMGLYGFHHTKPTSFECVAGILRLSTKYIVPTLRQQALDHIGRVVVTDFHKLDQVELRQNVFGPNFPAYFQLVALFLECHLARFLPYAFCQACIERDFTSNVIHCSDAHMSPRDKFLALDGRQKLLHNTRNFIHETVTSRASGCTCNDTLRMQWLNLAYTEDWDEELPLSRWSCFEMMVNSPKWLENFSSIEWPQCLPKGGSLIPCPACRDLWLDLEEKGREKLWNKLPVIFGLAAWDVLLDDEDIYMELGHNDNIT